MRWVVGEAAMRSRRARGEVGGGGGKGCGVVGEEDVAQCGGEGSE